jgi:hypothetical protein
MLKRKSNRRFSPTPGDTEMLTIQDLSKEVDMTAVRGGWQHCGDEEHRDRDECRHDDDDRCDRDRDRHRCGLGNDASASFGLAGSFKLSSSGNY